MSKELAGSVTKTAESGRLSRKEAVAAKRAARALASALGTDVVKPMKEAAPAERAASRGASPVRRASKPVKKAAPAKRAAPGHAPSVTAGTVESRWGMGTELQVVELGQFSHADFDRFTAGFAVALVPGRPTPQTDSSVARLKDAVERMQRLSVRRPNVDPSDLLALALERVVDTIEASELAPSGRALTADQRAVLESVGSYVEDMPPLDERASELTRTRWEELRDSSLTTKEVAERLGVGDSRIRQRAGDRSLYSIPVDGKTRFPTFQFTGRRLDPDLDVYLETDPRGWSEVAKAIPGHAHPLAVAYVATHPSEELEVEGELVSPIDYLASGGSATLVAEVVASALTLA